jgi:hypothetical protein
MTCLTSLTSCDTDLVTLPDYKISSHPFLTPEVDGGKIRPGPGRTLMTKDFGALSSSSPLSPPLRCVLFFFLRAPIAAACVYRDVMEISRVGSDMRASHANISDSLLRNYALRYPDRWLPWERVSPRVSSWKNIVRHEVLIITAFEAGMTCACTSLGMRPRRVGSQHIR